jgi:hypothetical protein
MRWVEVGYVFFTDGFLPQTAGPVPIDGGSAVHRQYLVTGRARKSQFGVEGLRRTNHAEGRTVSDLLDVLEVLPGLELVTAASWVRVAG